MVTKADKDAAASEPCEFDQTLDSAGVDGKFVAEQLKGLIEATETKAQIPKGEKAFVYSKKMKALDINFRAVELTAKLKNFVPSEKVKHTITLEDTLRGIHEKRDNDKD